MVENDPERPVRIVRGTRTHPDGCPIPSTGIALRIKDTGVILNVEDIIKDVQDALGGEKIDEIHIVRQAEGRSSVFLVSDKIRDPVVYTFDDQPSAIIFYRFVWDHVSMSNDAGRTGNTH